MFWSDIELKMVPFSCIHILKCWTFCLLCFALFLFSLKYKIVHNMLLICLSVCVSMDGRGKIEIYMRLFCVHVDFENSLWMIHDPLLFFVYFLKVSTREYEIREREPICIIQCTLYIPMYRGSSIVNTFCFFFLGKYGTHLLHLFMLVSQDVHNAFE